MQNKTHTTTSAEETQKLGEKMAEQILKSASTAAGEAIVLGLNGNLGGGKTTFLQGFAKGLGIKDKITSPTFVIMKRFEIKTFRRTNLKNFYHIDCYRLKDENDILEIGFKEIVGNPENIIAIEWPEKIKNILPQSALFMEFKFIDENKRQIIF